MLHPEVMAWVGGEHPFLLALAELEALQDKCDAGPELVLNRVQFGGWKIADLYETTRWGLIGGGMDRIAADKLVRRMFETHPPMAFKALAARILYSSLYGPEDDPVGKDSAAAEETPTGETDAGNSAPSTASAPPLGSAPRKSGE